MTLHVELGEGTLEIRARDLVHFDEAEAHLSIPYEAIRQVRVEGYTPPAGTFALGNRAVAYADVTAGHYRRGPAWTFVAYDDPDKTVTLDLADFDFALRPYERVVLGVDDPEALGDALRARARGRQAAAGEDPEIAWTALGAGDAVVATDGTHVGTVTHPLGDLDNDLFEGIAFRSGTLRAGQMARPADIARITPGEVRLNLTAEEAAALPPVALEDLREVAPGRGIFRHGPTWKRESDWGDNKR